MNYLQCSFKLSPFEPFQEILIAELAELGFESFEEDSPVLKAYIVKDQFNSVSIHDILDRLKPMAEIEFSTEEIEKQNWNKVWEDNFKPILLGDFCAVRAGFHPIPKKVKYDILIEPKMSFGTGHHATTQLMLKQMSELEFQGSSVIDMGSGTGVLAILAELMGAEQILAIDIEEWAFENIQENTVRNNCSKIKAVLGDVNQLKDFEQMSDVFLANINKNILLRDGPEYLRCMNDNAHLLISGFYEHDVEDLKEFFQSHGLKVVQSSSQDDWACIMLKK